MSAPSSNVSGESSGIADAISPTSQSMLASHIAALRKTAAHWGIRLAWSLTAKIRLLAIIFLIVPAFLYLEFRSAYEESQQLLLRSVRERGLAISKSLLPLLETADSGTLPELGAHLPALAGEVTTIKLLLQPASTDAGASGLRQFALTSALRVEC